MPFPVTPITPENHPKNLDDRSPGSLVPEHFDEVDATYDGSGNLLTATYKLAGNVVATVTLTYTAGNVTNIKRT
jgi:hypothetical protein